MFEAARMSNPIACVTNGSELLSYLKTIVSTAKEGKNSLPKLVMLDLALPGSKALELISYMKSNESLKEVPIIALCCDGDMSDIDLAIEKGACTYLHPGFTFAEFFERTRFLKGQWTITR
ncbi:MAG: hypothetical protein ACO1QB_07975 [Verrucomicrobiales bacterium]